MGCQDPHQKSITPIMQTSKHTTGITRNQNNLTILHSLLQNNIFLFKEFQQHNEKPLPITLNFMLQDCQITSESVVLNFINKKQLKIHICIDGLLKISDVKQSLAINNCKQILQTKASESDGVTSKQLKFDLANEATDSVIVILQLQGDNTFFLITVYQKTQGEFIKMRQSLEWSGQTFILLDIYGTDSLFVNTCQDKCALCLDGTIDSFFLPCRHMCICRNCSTNYPKNSAKCPMCRTVYEKIINYRTSQQTVRAQDYSAIQAQNIKLNRVKIENKQQKIENKSQKSEGKQQKPQEEAQ